MRFSSLFVICLSIFIFPFSSSAAVVKCIGQDGIVEFREPPCLSDSQEVELGADTRAVNLNDLVKPEKNIVGIDMYHGTVYREIAVSLNELGYDRKILDNELNLESLNRLDALIIASTEKPFSKDEISAIKKFVKEGGGLVCAAEAWSWVSEADESSQGRAFPLNALGRQLGFRITGEKTSTPETLTTDIMQGVFKLKRSDWWASSVDLPSTGSFVIIRDDNLRVMGGTLQFGKGKVVVYGHDALLRDNPVVLHNSLLYVTDQLVPLAQQ